MMPFQAMRFRHGAAPSGGWVQTANLIPFGGQGGWNAYTLRQVIPASAFAAGSRVRLRLRSGSAAGSALNLAAAYFGVQAGSGDPYDFAATPTQVLFSGLPGRVVGDSTNFLTDEIIVPVTASAHVLSAYFSGSTDVATAPGSGWRHYYKAGNDASTVNASGYTAGAVDVSLLVTGVEVFQP